MLIHDSVGHALTAQTIQLESALLFCHSDPNKTQKYIEVSRELAIDALNEIRKSISTLRAELLQGKSLAETINILIENFHKITNIRANLSIDIKQPLDTDISIAIYRIIQEALTNISKHSNATTVDIILEKEIDYIHLRIEDNGQGFNTEQNTTGFGLQGINERVRALGGKFRVNSKLNLGCQIIVDIPLNKFNLSEE
ncbi:MAG: sensor histidine kinase [Cyanobacteria bacterium J06643_5]